MKQPRKGTTAIRTDEVERLRMAKGWSIEALAKRSGMSIRALRRILAGEHAFFSSIVLIAEALDVPALSLHEGHHSAPKAQVPFEPDTPVIVLLCSFSQRGRECWLYGAVKATMISALQGQMRQVWESPPMLALLIETKHRRPLFTTIDEFKQYGEVLWTGVGYDPDQETQNRFKPILSTIDNPQLISSRRLSEIVGSLRRTLQ